MADAMIRLLAAPCHVERRTTRSQGLDGLRFVCAVWVLLAHTLAWADLAAGARVVPEPLASIAKLVAKLFQPAYETHPAVLAFIVLSGYCVHRNGFRAGRFAGHIGPYAVRRAFRIYPVFLAATAVGVIAFGLAAAIDPKLATRLSGTSAIEPGLILAKLTGLSALLPDLNPLTYQGNAPLHTVMVEIMLYAVYPVGMLVMLRGGAVGWWAALGLIHLAGTLLCSQSAAWTNWWHNGSLAGFLIYWWIGALAISARHHPVFPTIVRIAAIVFVILTIVLLTKLTRGLIVVEAKKIAFAVLVAALVGALDDGRVGVGRIIAWLGGAGYSLYAFHAPLAYGLLIAGWPWWLVVPTAIAAGVVAYLAFERPLTGIGRRIAALHADRGAPPLEHPARVADPGPRP